MKSYTDGTLKSWTKDDLIKHIRCLEHNYNNEKAGHQDSIDINTKLVKLLNKYKIEWLKLNAYGSYEVVDCDSEDLNR